MVSMLTPDQITHFQQHLAAARRSGFRAIIHITGSEEFALTMASELLKAADYSCVKQLPDNDHSGSVSQYLQKLLGTEVDALVLNAWQGLNPNALGVASGCVRAGGALLLLTPPAEQWIAYADPDYQRMLSHHSAVEVTGRFVRHLLDCLAANTSVLRIDEASAAIDFPPDAITHSAFTQDFTEQHNAVVAIKRVATGHSKRPLVIQADRGRGKSSALGIAAAQLLLEMDAQERDVQEIDVQERDRHIVVTAPQVSCVQTLFQRAGLEVNANPGADLVIRHNNSTIRFVPVDVLLTSTETCDFLMIDEAAAIPSSLLEELLKRCNRIVFSTTVQGYEGNGRGFAVRFLPLLQQRLPQLRLLELTTPIRYASNDSLELFCHAALLLNTTTPQAVVLNAPVFSLIHRDELLRDKTRLQQLFALLVTAHYQTSPDDLRLLLDHPDVLLYIAEQAGVVLAVALVMQEGGFDEADCSQLVQHNRRFRGHLLPQTVLFNGYAEVLQARFERIVRIAVLPECQHQGLGKKLMQTIQKHSQSDFIGASFSAEPEVLRFWQNVGMQVVRLGVHKESSTGQFPCVVLKANNADAEKLLDNLVQVFRADLPYQLLSTNHLCSAELAMVLLADGKKEVRTSGLIEKDIDNKRVQLWLHKQCTFESVQPSLYRVLLHYARIAGVLQPDNAAHRLMVQKLLLNYSWPVVCAASGSSGRKEVEERIRSAWQVLPENESKNGVRT